MPLQLLCAVPAFAGGKSDLLSLRRVACLVFTSRDLQTVPVQHVSESVYENAAAAIIVQSIIVLMKNTSASLQPDHTIIKSTTNLGGGGGSGLLGGGGALTETVLEATVDRLEVGGTAGAGGLSALGLEAPVERTELGSRVTALSTGWGLVGFTLHATRAK